MNNTEFARAMAVLAAEHRTARAPAGVEQAVLAEFDAARQKRRGWMMAAALAGVAAGLAAGAVLIREEPAARPAAIVATTPPHRSELPAPVMAGKPALKPRHGRRSAAPRLADKEAPFVTIPYTVPLSPEENATVVRMTLSPSALALAGFPLQAIDPDRGTEADVLVGEDGRARAIRIVENFR